MDDDKQVVKCPQCGKRMAAKKEGNPNRMFTCSGCGFRASLMAFAKERKPEDQSQSSLQSSFQPSASEGGTRVEQPHTLVMNNPQTPAFAGNGSLRVIASGVTYSIGLGSHIVGRAHPTGHADIAIVCEDTYMSRHHLKIDAVQIAQGFEYRMSDNGSTNKVYLNGQVLPLGDIVILKQGDRIRIGHTELEFILK